MYLLVYIKLAVFSSTLEEYKSCFQANLMQVSGFYSFTFGKNVKAVSESLLLTIIDGILL